MEKKTSIHDIARHLNVSATTVSFVLNGKAEERKISTTVGEKILRYVEEIGYRPNHIAQSLRTGKSMIIGMLVEDISDPFFSSIARIIEENLYKLGYKIFHSSTNNSTDRAKMLLQIYRERQVDGYILAPAEGTEKDIVTLLSDSKPVILFDRYFPDLPTTNVVIDNFGGAFDACHHLVQQGFKNIAFITVNSTQIQMQDRQKGYEKAISENDLKKYVLKIAYNTVSGDMSNLIKDFLKTNSDIDAVVFATNYLAISGLSAIRDLGLRIPTDIGMVGFDDNTHFALFSPSITAIAQPIEEISHQAVQQLINSIAGKAKNKKSKTIVLPTKLIVRESSRKRKRPKTIVD